MALDISNRLDVEKIPCKDRFGDSFDGLVVPFGAKVIYWNNPKQNATGSSKFAPTGEEGIFLGYHVQPGFIFKKEYLVTPLKGAREAIQDSDFKILRVKRMEVPDGDFIYPLQNDEAKTLHLILTTRIVSPKLKTSFQTTLMTTSARTCLTCLV